MSEETVIRCCAPTLAAIKTGSLFSCPAQSQEELTESLRMVNRCLIHKDVRAFPLRVQHGRALIYLYRPQMLERDLQNPVAEDILRDAGYPKGKAIEKVAYLIRRLRECDSFPHEIGLFLGYPAVDVKGFIEHKECKCTGLWKVFESDEAEAQRYFARCRRCTEGYLRRKQEGWDLSRLTIRPRQFSYQSIA